MIKWVVLARGNRNRLVAGAMGLAYFVWLRKGFWGLGFSIINLVFLTLVLVGKKRRGGMDWFLAIGSMALGVGVAVRNYEAARGLAFGGILAANMLLAAKGNDGQGGLIEMLITGIKTGLNSVGELGREVLRISRGGKKWKNVFWGIVLAVPLVIVFGNLFAGGDILFGKFLAKIKWPKINEVLVFEIGTSVWFGGLVLSLLRIKMAKKIKEWRGPWREEGLEIPMTMAIVLQVLFAIFTGFCLISLTTSRVGLEKMGVNYSEYTRRGYGQMIVASLLAMGVVAGMEKVLAGKKLLYVYMAEILIFVAAASRRNYFYQLNNGFTRIRLMGYWLSAGMATVLVWQWIKVVKEKSRANFARGIVVIIGVMIVGLNWLNIDGIIAGVNPPRINGEIDWLYVSGLSDDAYKSLDKLIEETERGIETETDVNDEKFFRLEGIVQRLKVRLEKLKYISGNNWQNGGQWNWNRAKSYEKLRANEVRIQRMVERLQEKRQEWRERGMRNQLN